MEENSLYPVAGPPRDRGHNAVVPANFFTCNFDQQHMPACRIWIVFIITTFNKVQAAIFPWHCIKSAAGKFGYGHNLAQRHS